NHDSPGPRSQFFSAYRQSDPDGDRADRDGSVGERRDDSASGGPIDLGAIVPELQRFYGGSDPLYWVTKMPVPWLRRFIEQMPRLQAKEALLQDTQLVVAGGWRVEERTRRETVQRWQREAGMPPKRQRLDLSTKDAMKVFAALGIPVVAEG